MKKERINIVTLGCSKNKVDSEHLAALIPAQAYSLTHDGEEQAEIVVINTCGFIGDAKEESIDMILDFAEARKRGGEVKQLYVMGCLSQRYKKIVGGRNPRSGCLFFGVDQIDEVASAILKRQTEKKFLRTINDHFLLRHITPT